MGCGEYCIDINAKGFNLRVSSGSKVRSPSLVSIPGNQDPLHPSKSEGATRRGNQPTEHSAIKKVRKRMTTLNKTSQLTSRLFLLLLLSAGMAWGSREPYKFLTLASSAV
jgi:hypothetical protein